MEMLVCPQCGKEFEKMVHNQKFCSEYCGKKYRKLNGLAGFRPEKVSKEDLTEIKRLYESGIPKVHIAKQFNIGKSTLNRYLDHILTEESRALREKAQPPKEPKKPTVEKHNYSGNSPEINIKTLLALYLNPNDSGSLKNSYYISELYEDLGWYYADGLGSKEIAEKLDLPFEIVKRIFTFLSRTDFYVDRKKLKDKEKQALEDLIKSCYEEGLSGQVTAEKTGLNINTVCRKFRELNLTDSFEIRDEKYYKELKVVYDLSLKGYTQNRIREQLDLTKKQLELRLKMFRKITPVEELERLEKTRVHRKIW